MKNFYLSPICTRRLGDAIVSISNLYYRLSKEPSPVRVYYHHWPEYFRILWPFVDPPPINISFEKLPNSRGEAINDSLETLYKSRLQSVIRPELYRWHPARAYSLQICEEHPYIKSTLAQLGITVDRVLLNSTDLDDGADYVHFKTNTKKETYVTYQRRSVDKNGKLIHEIELIDKKVRSETSDAICIDDISDFENLLKIMSLARHHYGIDSGPTHLALALRIPVTIFFNNLYGHKGLEGIIGIYGRHLEKMRLIDCRF